MLLALPGSASAQSRLDGRITDSSGGVVRDVEVAVTPLGSQTPTAVVRTNAGGEFAFADLPRHLRRARRAGWIPPD
jgi:hypothetical protein